MSSTAKEFLRKRVVEHVWPKLVISLKQLRGVACDATPTISHTMEYKLLVKILESVGKLCKEVSVTKNKSVTKNRSTVYTDFACIINYFYS